VSQIEPNGIQRWSTTDVTPDSRLEYFASALSEAIIPLGVDDAETRDFHAELTLARLGEIEVCTQDCSPHRSFRGPSEFARTGGHRFHLVMTHACPWTVEHRERAELLAGDILLHDSQYTFRGDIRHKFTGINITLTEPWLRRWVPNPGVLVGRISGRSSWGSALSAFLAALTPELLAAPVLPATVYADQLGGLLALVASGLRAGDIPRLPPAVRSLHERILDCVAQRCTECHLTAPDVAASINVSLRTLHRTLAEANETFGAALMTARVRVAERMLTSPLFGRVTTAEIGRRAGFLSPSHFAKVVLKHTGKTPMQLKGRKSPSRGQPPISSATAPARPCSSQRRPGI
jgi:AraC family transcriptional regulator, positive regulator of tynA and feaB